MKQTTQSYDEHVRILWTENCEKFHDVTLKMVAQSKLSKLSVLAQEEIERRRKKDQKK